MTDLASGGPQNSETFHTNLCVRAHMAVNGGKRRSLCLFKQSLVCDNCMYTSSQRHLFQNKPLFFFRLTAFGLSDNLFYPNDGKVGTSLDSHILFTFIVLTKS